MVVDSVAEVVSQAAAEGIGVLSSGEGFGVDGSGKFAYLDTHAALGMNFEVIEPPPRRRRARPAAEPRPEISSWPLSISAGRRSS